MIRCVSLDFGGVMIQINHQWGDSLAQAGLPRRELGHLLDFPFTDSVGDSEADESRYFASLGEFIGHGPAEAERVHDAVLRSEYPGMLDLVTSLKAQDLCVAGLSNTNARHVRHMLTHFPSVAALDRIVASYDVHLKKPDPGIYTAFEEITGFGPHEIVFFDDMPANVAAAEQAGWRAFQIDPKGDTALQIVQHLTDLKVL